MWTVNWWKDENKEKYPGIGPSLKTYFWDLTLCAILSVKNTIFFYLDLFPVETKNYLDGNVCRNVFRSATYTSLARVIRVVAHDISELYTVELKTFPQTCPAEKSAISLPTWVKLFIERLWTLSRESCKLARSREEIFRSPIKLHFKYRACRFPDCTPACNIPIRENSLLKIHTFLAYVHLPTYLPSFLPSYCHGAIL